MEERRADPDALLRQVQDAERRAGRGKLKIFFGATAGVGKTYAMLEAAQRQRAAGLDVVVGYVEPHGRPDTERLLDGLSQLPWRATAAGLPEFDLDAALARRPALLLVDELAHTNAPGARHARRWQDVEELRDAGIDVYSTLNVQHLDSLNDVLAAITGARQQETVPDTVFESADEVELVDLAPAELLQRLREGKVYLPRQAQLALENFFREGNLIALRELALRKTAERVDAAMQRWRDAEAVSQPWAAGERIMVAIGPAGDGDALVRAGKRLAAALHAPWIVVYVETPDLIRLPEAERNQRIALLRRAATLGAETVTLGGAAAGDELVAYARRRNVSRLLLGAPRRAPWRRLLRPSVVDRVLALAQGIDVTVVKTTEAQRLARSPWLARSRAYLQPAPTGKRRWPGYAAAAGAVALATLAGFFSAPFLSDTNTALLYLAGIVLVAWRYGRGPSVLASALAVAAFNFFFVEPVHSFSVADGQYLITFAVLMAVGLLIGQLMAGVRLQARVAGHRERRTALLYAMSRELVATRGLDHLARVAVRHIGEVYDAQVAVLLPDAAGRLRAPRGSPEPASLRAADLSIAQWVLERGQPAGLGTDTLPGAPARYLPLTMPLTGPPTTPPTPGGTPPVALGVLAVLPANPRRVLLPEAGQLLATFAGQLALALERAELGRQAETAQLRAQAEALRNDLLASISHDLRTPLAVIAGAAASLTDERLDAAQRRELAQSIERQAGQMTQMVANVLDMIRLDGGAVPRRDWVALEEPIGAARHRLGAALALHPVEVDLAAAPALVYADPVLLEQLLFNLLDNAVRHTPPGTRIRIAVRTTGEELELLVADDGPGFPPGAAPERLFDKFQRGRPENAAGGVGLGLAICRAIAQAHGGSIRAEAIPAGGALFVLALPLAAAPAVAAEGGP
jgi:two-component system sensor histidine kinase KdpD